MTQLFKGGRLAPPSSGLLAVLCSSFLHKTEDKSTHSDCCCCGFFPTDGWRFRLQLTDSGVLLNNRNSRRRNSSPDWSSDLNFWGKHQEKWRTQISGTSLVTSEGPALGTLKKFGKRSPSGIMWSDSSFVAHHAFRTFREGAADETSVWDAFWSSDSECLQSQSEDAAKRDPI